MSNQPQTKPYRVRCTHAHGFGTVTIDVPIDHKTPDDFALKEARKEFEDMRFSGYGSKTSRLEIMYEEMDS